MSSANPTTYRGKARSTGEQLRSLDGLLAGAADRVLPDATGAQSVPKRPETGSRIHAGLGRTRVSNALLDGTSRHVPPTDSRVGVSWLGSQRNGQGRGAKRKFAWSGTSLEVRRAPRSRKVAADPGDDCRRPPHPSRYHAEVRLV